jgi:hypothetical protein
MEHFVIACFLSLFVGFVVGLTVAEHCAKDKIAKLKRCIFILQSRM